MKNYPKIMDIYPHWPKAAWGFNGTEHPDAVQGCLFRQEQLESQLQSLFNLWSHL